VVKNFFVVGPVSVLGRVLFAEIDRLFVEKLLLFAKITGLFALMRVLFAISYFVGKSIYISLLYSLK
jgi:hypothetical protein